MASEGVVPRIRVAVIEVAALTVDVPVRCPRTAPLGRDDDDAIRGIRTVQRGGRRSFHDLDVLDLLGIDVANSAGVAATGAIAIAPDIARHANAVDHVDRIVRQVERVLTTNADA